MRQQIKKWREERAKLAEEARKIIKTAHDDGDREFTADEQKRFDEIHADCDRLKEKVDREERQLELEEQALERQTVPAGRDNNHGDISADEAEDRQRRYIAAFDSFLRFGHSQLTEEEVTVLNEHRSGISPEVMSSVATLRRVVRPGGEQRANMTKGAGVGLEFVPEGFWNGIQEAKKQFGGVRAGRTTKITTSTGNDLPIPTSDDTGNVGQLLAEAAEETNTQEVPTGAVILHAYKYSTKFVKVSLELLQDSAFDLDAFLRRKMGERIGRIENTHFTTGDGSSKPRGIVTGATDSTITFTANTPTYDKMVDVEHSVDPAYRMDPSCSWMFHDSTLKLLKKLKDSDGRPLWVPGLTSNAPDTFLDYPYGINQDMADMATSTNKFLLFGAVGAYTIRDVKDLVILRVEERFIEFGLVAFIGFQRIDGDLVEPGSSAATKQVKYAAVA